MSQPTVAAVLLTFGRPAEMVRTAVECVYAQNYPNLTLVILDTDQEPVALDIKMQEYSHCPDYGGHPVGELRNVANGDVKADIIVHFDDDDWSHPNRIAEQVALLQSSGADAVGYNEALFWREGRLIYDRIADESYTDSGSALLYSNRDPRYCLGTSLCYWRKTWERKPFRATSSGEDFHFCEGLNTVGVTSMRREIPAGMPGRDIRLLLPVSEPRMVARIHAGNTSKNYADCDREQSPGWRKVPEWNSYCAERMKL